MTSFSDRKSDSYLTYYLNHPPGVSKEEREVILTHKQFKSVVMPQPYMTELPPTKDLIQSNPPSVNDFTATITTFLI